MTAPEQIPTAVLHGSSCSLGFFSFQQKDREFLLRMSYMEIYNEEINDLLAPEHRKLQIHESIELMFRCNQLQLTFHVKRGIYVAGLREEIVASPEQVLDFMAFGESHRHIGETNMNVYSSRSHTIFRMIIESRDKTEDEDTNSSCDAVRVSILNLVDLAGSERAAKTGAEGVRLKEGSHINKSLMTLGTVIKKLSEGAESQGSHVPYRDSKLTRILQPALGGNANTAIICNITLAQIHADETKSSLQFASRALRVTNCVHVNEILTDAALLKRQKKEIEELRARLQGSHSEHFEEEILNLRNTLLQTELERERIALELEEEKKAQAAREKRLQEQAKKIENLSSMVLCSNRDENRDRYKKLQEKRRDTWCPGNLSKETLRELHYAVQEKASAMKPARDERDTGPLLPFEELLNVASINASSEQKEDCKTNGLENCSLPDPHALLHVTSRKKPPLRKKISQKENHELVEMQEEYEDLLQKFETQKTISDIQIDYLTKQLGEAGFHMDEKSQDNSSCHINECTTPGKSNLLMTKSEAILVIKQLQEKIRILETEKSSSLQNLDSVVELATEQNIYAREKYEKLYEDVLKAREEAKVAHEQLASTELVDNLKSFTNLLAGVQEVMLEVRCSTNLSEDVSSVVDELFQTVKAIWAQLTEFKVFASENSMQVKSIIRDHEKLQSCMRNKLNELNSEKVLLCNQSVDLHSKIQELSLNWQESEKALKEFSEQNEMEISEFQYHIETLQKEISCLSSCSLAKEKENMRKDLEKTKTKLKETEFKLRNAIQEKTKLEGEKACAEREIKQLHGQKVILERDISKRDRCSIGFDPKRTKGVAVSFDQTMQEDFGKLEVLAFEMERTIASLEDQLAATRGEKEEALSGIEHYALEMQVLSDKLNMSNTELSTLQDVVSSLRSSLEESQSYSEKLETSLNVLVQEKEEWAMRLSDTLSEIEEENEIWYAKERTSVVAIEKNTKTYNAEIAYLSNCQRQHSYLGVFS
ncbi:hypothetical protein RJ640_023677 [Escallonia rubra]|uniref:Kinesin motor domain-containing protein n=1 Tax=Escallonia rubra TaxID=112253 RepID=A0AA88RK16_9ASTE|nr:hypothetical protein RJ640_023677 [Escallonia rubra]